MGRVQDKSKWRVQDRQEENENFASPPWRLWSLAVAMAVPHFPVVMMMGNHHPRECRLALQGQYPRSHRPAAFGWSSERARARNCADASSNLI